MSKNVLVLGGTGFVGRHVVPKLVAASHRVVVPTRSRDRARPLFPLPTCTIIEADIHDRAALGKLARGSDAVVNLVGILQSRAGTPYGADFAQAHVDLPRRIVAAARQAHPAWALQNAEERTAFLFRAAAVARSRRPDLLAWQVLETVK